ncbi:hypothetical protein CDCA_CDCA09G2609 [Cyanidium caldarium]|uniref:GOST seven transmembrane domain-containing protein n=1 Tax=Cyanidium caldarium TaxID=2771 RepID=A0AAV9IWT9_CYACA|nr:hypothetical protein CDCA_CDCA09G2609 [Cyanidium caldarium]
MHGHRWYVGSGRRRRPLRFLLFLLYGLLVLASLLALGQPVVASVYRRQLRFGSASDDGSCCWVLSDGALVASDDWGGQAEEAFILVQGAGRRLAPVQDRASNTTVYLEMAVFHSSQRGLIGYRVSPDAYPEYCCTEELALMAAGQGVPGCRSEDVGRLIVAAERAQVIWDTAAADMEGISGAARRVLHSHWADLGDGTSAHPATTTAVDLRAVAHPASPHRSLFLHALALPANRSVYQRVYERFPITQSGVYDVVLASCTDAPVTFRGAIEFRSPYGYLPGQLHGLLPFFGWLVVAYLVATAVWVVACHARTHLLHPVQYGVTALFFFGMLESFFNYEVYYWANRDGQPLCCPPSGVEVLGDLLATMKHTLTKVLVLAVSMGLQVVTPSLPPQKLIRLVWFAVAYSIGTLALELLETVGHLGEARLWVALMAILPVSVLEAVFYAWTFAEMRNNIAYLVSRQRTEKLRMYIRFVVLLIVVAVVGLAFELYVIWTNARRPQDVERWFDRNWRRFWLLGGFPTLGAGAFYDGWYFVLLLGIAAIWRPAHATLTYHYMPEAEDAETVTQVAVQAERDTVKSAPGRRADPAKRKLQARFDLGDDADDADGDEERAEMLAKRD